MSHRKRLVLGVMTGACLVFVSLQGLTTYARYSDGTTIAASAGAGTWVSTVAPAACIDMTFDGDPIVGTDGPDVLLGPPGTDLILGLGGDDLIFGGVGPDWLVGGGGPDSLGGHGSSIAKF